MSTQPPDSSPVSFWLLPAAPYADRLAQVVAELAREFDAPAFEPHVTLFAGRESGNDDVAALAAQAVAATDPLELTAAATGTTADLFKSLFVEFAPDARLDCLCELFRKGLRLPSDYVLRPHLSLMYKQLPEPTRIALTKRYAFAGQKIGFDAIALVRPCAGADDWADIESWRIDSRWTLM